MNNDQAKSVDIVFTRGVRQDLDPHTAPPGSLVACENLEFDQLGRLVKRDGFATVSVTPISKSSTLTTQVRRFAQANDTRLIFADNSAFIYLPDKNEVTLAAPDTDGCVPSVNAAMTDVSGVAADNNGGLKFCDAISVGVFSVYLYVQFDGVSSGYNVWVETIDVTSKARVITKKQLGTSAGNYPCRLVVSGGSSIVFALWEDSVATTIRYAKVDLATEPIAWSVSAALVTDTGPAIFDADTMASGWVFVYYSAASTRPRVSTYNSIPTQLNTVLWAASTGGAWTPSILAVSGISFSGSTLVHVAGYNGATFLLEGATYTSVMVLSAQSGSDPGLDHAKHAKQMAIIRIAAGTTLIAFSNYASNTVSTNPRGHLIFYKLVDAGTLTLQSSTLYNYSLASRFYMDSVARGQYLYIVARFDDPSGTQNHFLLLSIGGGVSILGVLTPFNCHFASGRVPLLAENAMTGIGGMVDMSSTQAGLFQFSTITNIGASQFSGNQIQAWTFQSLSTQRYLSVNAQRELVVAGGTPLAFDDQRLIELSFYSYPVLRSGNMTPSAAGGSIAQGIYQYRPVFEWTDANGNRHQSPAGPAITMDLSSATYVAGTNSVAISVASIQTTRKQGRGNFGNPAVSVVYYRTLAGGVIFYRLPGAAQNRMGQALASTFTDTYADASISGNEPIYATNGGQGLLASTAPPPTLAMATHAGRLWGVDCENPERIWCTRVLQPGSAPAYNQALQILIPGAGRINGIAGQDGKLYALATNGIYLATYGDGPDDTGAGAFPSPELITTAANCTDPRGVFIGQNGIFFTGNDQWGTGIYLIRRGDGDPISIGKRVRNELATHPVCRGIVDRISKARTEFLFVDSDTAPSSSVILYYHHDYLDEDGVGQWTTVPFGAVECIGEWDDLSVIASDATNAIGWQTVGTAQDFEGSYPQISIQTTDIRPAGLLGFAQIAAVSMLGTKSSADPIEIELSYDSGYSWPDFYTWPATSENSGQPVIRRREPATQKQFDGSTIRIRLSDPPNGGSNPGKTFFHGIAIEVVGLGGNARLNDARRS